MARRLPLRRVDFRLCRHQPVELNLKVSDALELGVETLFDVFEQRFDSREAILLRIVVGRAIAPNQTGARWDRRQRGKSAESPRHEPPYLALPGRCCPISHTACRKARRRRWVWRIVGRLLGKV
jgi:hypothetical protein